MTRQGANSGLGTGSAVGVGPAVGADAARDATAALGAWAAGLTWETVPEPVRDRLLLVLTDTLGVTAAGMRLPESRALVLAWAPPSGPAPLVGGGLRTTPDAAAWLNGFAVVCLELDEGNKYARGHPAAHGFPAVLAMAAARRARGADVAAALLAAHEVASRFGRATRLRPGTHPHGNWGVPGAAAGVARLLGLDAAATAAAVDTAAGLPLAGHFEAALSGNPVRDAWVGAANAAGIVAARMAAAGVACATGTAAHSLGGLLGAFDPGALTEELGTRYDVTTGYFKRHAACSFTHPPADALLALAARHPELRSENVWGDVERIEVETHSLAAGLDRAVWPSRLAAMFSIPFVAAVALLHGRVSPEASGDRGRADPRVVALAGRVSVRVAGDLDRRLPAERAARVTVTLRGGRRLTHEIGNPVGDADHEPFDRAAVDAKLAALLGRSDPTLAGIRQLSRTLPAVPDAAPLLAQLT